MRKDKEKARELRKNGSSYNKIAGILNVPKSTLSHWFSDKDWSIKIKKELNATAREKHRLRIIALDKVRGKKLAKAYDSARQEAQKEVRILKYHPLFVAGLMLYWGEGDKRTKGTVRLSNTDPEMIALFVRFLKEICQVPEADIKAGILLYPDLHDEACKKYWSRHAGLPKTNFRKSVRIVGRHKTRRLSNGVCNVYVTSTYLKVKMAEWLKHIAKELMSEEYYASI